MLLTPGCHHQFRTVAFGPLLQLLTGRVEGQSGGTCEHAGRDITLMFLDTIPHHLFQFLLIGQNRLSVRVVVAAEPVEPLLDLPVPQLPWLILHTVESHVTIFHLFGIRHLPGQ